MKVKFHPHARVEVKEARKWYHERSPLSATAFVHAIESAVFSIAATPMKFPLTEHGTRKIVLQ